MQRTSSKTEHPAAELLQIASEGAPLQLLPAGVGSPRPAHICNVDCGAHFTALRGGRQEE